MATDILQKPVNCSKSKFARVFFIHKRLRRAWSRSPPGADSTD